jgi:ATP-dependent Clp protease ATP-binding subunit ClpX
MSPLDRDALKAILTLPKNALIKQYQHLFHMDGIALTFDENVFDYIVDVALEYKLGARGLRSVCEAVLNDHMFDAPGAEHKELVITLDYAKSQIERSSLRKLKRVV